MTLKSRLRRARLAWREFPVVYTPLAHATCVVEPDDSALVAVLTAPEGEGQYVTVDVRSGDVQHGVVLDPATARAFAAGLLNAADSADGTTPLTFCPPGPTATEPPEMSTR